eukprot:2774476-Lingulodinium_polyedra.AAC.1
MEAVAARRPNVLVLLSAERCRADWAVGQLFGRRRGQGRPPPAGEALGLEPIANLGVYPVGKPN